MPILGRKLPPPFIQRQRLPKVLDFPYDGKRQIREVRRPGRGDRVPDADEMDVDFPGTAGEGGFVFGGCAGCDVDIAVS